MRYINILCVLFVCFSSKSEKFVWCDCFGRDLGRASVLRMPLGIQEKAVERCLGVRVGDGSSLQRKRLREAPMVFCYFRYFV